jgi:3-hydroxyacyl-CoA dehydrogenase
MTDAPLVRLERHNDVGVIIVNNPPVNALSPGVPEGIVACFNEAHADPALRAMVLIGDGRSFIAGADIRNFGKGRPPVPPGSRSHDVLDTSTKPIVAAIHGYALGGGLENAMACNYRIAKRSAKVGLPEVLIGILPGGGGTQRLPRLIGPKLALDLIVSGRHVPAPEALTMGIVDAVVDDAADVKQEAIAFARKVADGRPLPQVSSRTDKLDEAKADLSVATSANARAAKCGVLKRETASRKASRLQLQLNRVTAAKAAAPKA